MQFEVLHSQRLNQWKIYEIDFNRMQQTNLESTRIRQVRLVPTDCNAMPALEDRKRNHQSEEEGDPDQQGASSNRVYEEARGNKMPEK